jgi:hypothetical protein
LRAFSGFFQSDLQVVAQIGATIDLAAAATLATTPEATSPATEDFFEDVAEVKATGTAAESTMPHGRIHAGMTVLIVGGTLVGIREYFVGFLGFLELGFGCFVIRIAVRVVFHGQATVGLFQLFVGGTFGYTQNFVVIAFGHGSSVSVRINLRKCKRGKVALAPTGSLIRSYFLSFTSVNSASTTSPSGCLPVSA